MPNAKSERFADRVRKLLESDYDNPLPVLVEIRSYLLAGHISDNDYLSACEKLLGDVEARDLSDGDLPGKESALEQFLPGEFEVEIEEDIR